MAHLLAKLRNVKYEVINQVLENDALVHAQEGLFLEHLWQNVDDENEILFLFRINDIEHAKSFIDRVHSQALKENPNVNLPKMIYLK